MSQRPTFRAQLDSQRPRGATSLIGEQTLEQRVAALERAMPRLPQFNVGTITINSGTGAQSFTGVGFQPRMLILFGTNGASGAIGMLSIGVSDGTSHRVGVVRADATDGQMNQGNFAYALITDNSSTLSARGTITSFNEDGFTIERVASSGSGHTLSYIAIG
jgi:hypothetical protein